MNTQITSILNTIREQPAGDDLFRLDDSHGETWTRNTGISTDSLHQLADYIERVEAMLGNAVSIGFQSPPLGHVWLEGVSRRWVSERTSDMGPNHSSALEAYEALKENTDAN